MKEDLKIISTTLSFIIKFNENKINEINSEFEIAVKVIY